jgi:hypothetical protein
MMDSTERSQLDHLVTSLLVSPMGRGGIEFGQNVENLAENVENLAKMLRIWPKC